MNTKIKFLIIIGSALLIGFTGCKKQKYTLVPFAPPSDLKLTITIIGQSDSMPNGDGLGAVVFNVSAKNAALYRIDFGGGSGAKTVATFPDTVTYSKEVGTHKYGVTVTAYGVANANPAISIVDTVNVYYAYHVDPAILTMLTNNSNTGKRWMVDDTASGNMGIGPISSYFPDYYNANPGDKTGDGLYTNVYTFTDQGEFVDSTYNKIFGSKIYFARDFSASLPGEFGGYGNDWILYWPTYSTKYAFSSGTASASSTGVYINFEKPGSVGYYTGTQQFDILSITDSTMWLRTVQPDVGLAYYVKLKAKR